jgi:hypothetical protein
MKIYTSILRSSHWRMQQQTTDMGLSVSSDFIGMAGSFKSNVTSHYHFAIEQHQSLSTCFCSYGLEKNFQHSVYEDFEKLTLEFYHSGDIYGLEKYW